MTSRLKTIFAVLAVVFMSLTGAACSGGEDVQVNVGSTSTSNETETETEAEPTTCALEEVEDEYGMMVEVETCE